MIFKAIKMLLAVLVGILYIPLNLLLMKLSEIYKKRRKSHPLEFWAIRIVMFPLWGVVAILSAPYEMLIESAH